MIKREPTTSGRRLAAIDRDTEILELRKRGLTFAQIGAQVGCNRSNVHHRIQKYMESIGNENLQLAEEYREIEAAKLDMVEEALMPKMLQGDVEAVSAGIRLMARRAKLLGLDMTNDGKGGMVINVIDPNNYTPAFNSQHVLAEDGDSKEG